MLCDVRLGETAGQFPFTLAFQRRTSYSLTDWAVIL